MPKPNGYTIQPWNLATEKAKLYRTARIIDDAWELPEGFTAGEFVAVQFLRKAFGACVYQCTNTAGHVAAISEFELEGFVL